jgi:hypothetical protein
MKAGQNQTSGQTDLWIYLVYLREIHGHVQWATAAEQMVVLGQTLGGQEALLLSAAMVQGQPPSAASQQWQRNQTQGGVHVLVASVPYTHKRKEKRKGKVNNTNSLYTKQ